MKWTFIFLILILSLTTITAFETSKFDFDYSTTTTNIYNYTINGTEVEHNNLTGLDGGTANEYYHLSYDQYNTFNSGVTYTLKTDFDTHTGDTTILFHKRFNIF